MPVARSRGTRASSSQARTAAATLGSSVCLGHRSVPSTSEATRRMASGSAGPEAAESGTARRAEAEAEAAAAAAAAAAEEEDEEEEEEERASRGLTAASRLAIRGEEAASALARSLVKLAGRCERPFVSRVEHWRSRGGMTPRGRPRRCEPRERKEAEKEAKIEREERERVAATRAKLRLSILDESFAKFRNLFFPFLPIGRESLSFSLCS